MDNRRASPVWLWLFLLAILLVTLIVGLEQLFPETLRSEDNQLSFVLIVLWIVFLGGAFVARVTSGGLKLMLGSLMIWVFVGLSLVTLYSFRNELTAWKDRVVAELLPHRGATQRPGSSTARTPYENSISFRQRQGGHFVVEAQVNGTPLRFMVDTGASDVVLTPADARRIGINPNTLNYTQRYNTANGVMLGAPVRLNRVRVGPIEVDDVRASVNKAEMGASLLGMSFLGRLSGYEVRDGTLTLRQ